MKRITGIRFSAILLSVITLFPGVAFGQGKNINRTYSWNYGINSDARITFENYDCDLVVHTWDKEEVRYEMTVDASMNSAEDASELNSSIEALDFSNSQAHVAINNRFWKSRNNIAGRKTMKLEKGGTVGYRDFSMKGELWIPGTVTFDINSRYSGIEIGKMTGDLILNLYNDKVNASDCGRVEISAKYGTIDIKDNKGINANLYNCELYTGNTGNFTVESKYSKVYGKVTGDMDINSYNDKFTFEKTGNIKFISKYSDLKTNIAGLLDADTYEGTIEINELTDIKLNSKYTKFAFETLSNCRVESIYNSRISTTTMKSLTVFDSKYCTYDIGNLDESIVIDSGYEDKIFVRSTGKDFSGMKLNGKYLKAELGLKSGYDFRFRANIKYPHLDMDEESLTVRIKIVESSQLKYEAVMGTERDGMPVIDLEGYEISFRLIDL